MKIFIFLFLLLSPFNITAAGPMDDGVYLATDGNLLYLLVLNKRAGDRFSWGNLTNNKCDFVEHDQSEFKREDGKLSSFGNTFIVETIVRGNSRSERLIQTDLFFVMLGHRKVNMEYSRVYTFTDK